MAKQTKITIETDSLLVVRARTPLRAWCPQCAGEVEMIQIEGVGVVSNLSALEVETWLECEEIHRTQAADGAWGGMIMRRVFGLNDLGARAKDKERENEYGNQAG